MLPGSPPPKPNQLRVWLKQAIESGALERIPSQYPLASGSRDTFEYARGLLAELRDHAANARPLEAIVKDARQFRAWVETRQQVSRRIILAESRAGEGFETEFTQPAPEDPPRLRGETRPAPRSKSPRPEPMWDDWLDGPAR